jgi:eukaryotic-like serine/threonine-protein kinase
VNQKVVVGDYTLLEQIGEGAFGRTFRGEHSVLGLPVCLKQEKTGNPQFKQLFRREAELLWGLSHPSLPVVRGYLEHPEWGQFIVMSFVEGICLEDDILKNGPLEDEHVMWILQRLLDALSYLHYKQIIHCDIKPKNVILQLAEHNAVLVDFGIAASAPGADSMALGGTDGYMPPEFDAGYPPVPASDFYSLAKVGIFMAGGDPAAGTIPADMCGALRELLEEMTVFDAVRRRELLGDEGRTLSARITKMRRKVFGRTESVELIKRR